MFLSLANDWLSVVAADVVELDAVVVDSVQNSQAVFAALTVVRLGTAVAEKLRGKYSRDTLTNNNPDMRLVRACHSEIA